MMMNLRTVARLIATSLVLLTCGADRAAADLAADAMPTMTTMASLARADWLLDRLATAPGMPGLSRLATVDQQSEMGGVGGGSAVAEVDDGGHRGAALPMAMSLVLPGLGEAYLGHIQGYALMAIDVASWIGVAHYVSEGDKKRDEYYDYADAHWREDKLAAAYGPDVLLPGNFYFGVTDYTELPLWVSVDADRREYYENLGKWDQFVFGWDDFMRPDDYASLPGNEDYEPTGDPKIDFANPWVSENRESYRLMRDASNDAFKSRDRWLYVNIGLRIFSVLQTAWLDGLLGGDGGGEGDTKLSVNGHEVRLIAQPTGLRRATVAATVSF